MSWAGWFLLGFGTGVAAMYVVACWMLRAVAHGAREAFERRLRADCACADVRCVGPRCAYCEARRLLGLETP